MPEYRAYFIGREGHFLKSVGLVCDDDEVAKKETEQLVDAHDIELWQRDRSVATFPRKE